MALPYLSVITGVVISTYITTPPVGGQPGSSVTIRNAAGGDVVRLSATGAEAEAAGQFLRTGESVVAMSEQIDDLVFGKWDALLRRLAD